MRIRFVIHVINLHVAGWHHTYSEKLGPKCASYSKEIHSSCGLNAVDAMESPWRFPESACFWRSSWRLIIVWWKMDIGIHFNFLYASIDSREFSEIEIKWKISLLLGLLRFIKSRQDFFFLTKWFFNVCKIKIHHVLLVWGLDCYMLVRRKDFLNILSVAYFI